MLVENPMKNRILFYPCCFLLPVVGFLSPTRICGQVENAAVKKARPNFVIIMADDLGYGDIGCFGNRRIRTPHIDSIAARGIRFTDFHSSGTVCSPTRCGLMTGRYQQRAGIPAVVSVKHKHLGMPPSELTFAEVLKATGYATAIYGKWHLGYQTRFNPVHQGFDEFRGYVSGNVDFFSHIDQAGAFDWWINDQKKDEQGYSTHLITRHAVDFIKRRGDQPFCLYLAHEAPHYPYQGPGDSAERTVGGKFKTQGSRTDVADAYREMVEAMDDGVGQVLRVLKEKGLDKNTLVWFFSDNGANQRGDNGGLRGFKGSVWEGGHRVPACACWPGTIPAGKESAQLATTLDVFPTITSLMQSADTRIPPLDGIDLSRTLFSGQDCKSQREFFWGSGKQRAMRDGQWKLVTQAKGQGNRTELFDLGRDRAEKQDMSGAEPDRVKKMLEAISKWDQDVGPSSFSR